MKHVWNVLVYARDNDQLVSSEIFSSEKSAHSYADIYRERGKFYSVFVNKKEIRL